jgi:geranylgeranyl diphosphate synthase type I
LVHNFSLLHDDVMDEDRTRRNRLTAWAVFGAGPAILAGDAMLVAASDVLARSGAPWAASAVQRLGDDVVALCEGQFADLAFEQRVAVSVDECLAMAASKTGALLGGSCALGGLAGGADEHCIGLLAAFGRQLGLAFQLRDDLLGIWGDPELTGKPVGSDVVRRKKSFPVIAAMASGTAAGAELVGLYHRDGPLDADQVARATDLIEQAGGRDLARDEAASQLAQALASLDAIGCASKARDELIAIANLMIDRRH